MSDDDQYEYDEDYNDARTGDFDDRVIPKFNLGGGMSARWKRIMAGLGGIVAVLFLLGNIGESTTVHNYAPEGTATEPEFVEDETGGELFDCATETGVEVAADTYETCHAVVYGLANQALAMAGEFDNLPYNMSTDATAMLSGQDEGFKIQVLRQMFESLRAEDLCNVRLITTTVDDEVKILPVASVLGDTRGVPLFKCTVTANPAATEAATKVPGVSGDS